MGWATAAGTLSSLSAAIEIGRGLLAANTAMETATLKVKAVELMEALIASKTTMLALMEDNEARGKEIARLNEALVNKSKVERRENAFYDLAQNGEPEGDPYCMHCWEKNHELAHLSLPLRTTDKSWCPRCKSQFEYVRTQRIKSTG